MKVNKGRLIGITNTSVQIGLSALAVALSSLCGCSGTGAQSQPISTPIHCPSGPGGVDEICPPGDLCVDDLHSAPCKTVMPFHTWQCVPAPPGCSIDRMCQCRAFAADAGAVAAATCSGGLSCSNCLLCGQWSGIYGQYGCETAYKCP